jgi:hypothetical protein
VIILDSTRLYYESTDANRWDEKAGLRRDAVRSQVIDVLEAQEIKETGNEEGYERRSCSPSVSFGATFAAFFFAIETRKV